MVISADYIAFGQFFNNLLLRGGLGHLGYLVRLLTAHVVCIQYVVGMITVEVRLAAVVAAALFLVGVNELRHTLAVLTTAFDCLLFLAFREPVGHGAFRYSCLFLYLTK